MVRTLSGFGPMTRILGVLGIGMVAGAALTAQPQAQDAGSAALAAQVAALSARVDALEAEKDKPLEVKAPFRVLTDSGKEIFSISEGGNAAPMMKLTGSGSSIELSTGDKAKIELNHGNQYAFLSAEGTAARSTSAAPATVSSISGLQTAGWRSFSIRASIAWRSRPCRKGDRCKRRRPRRPSGSGCFRACTGYWPPRATARWRR